MEILRTCAILNIPIPIPCTMPYTTDMVGSWPSHKQLDLYTFKRAGPGPRLAGMWSLLWTKRHWGGFSQSTSVSPANHHILPGLAQ
jgi:hypothetical protein